MKFFRRHFLPLSLAGGIAVVGWSSGCAGFFLTKQKVTVDAISAPGIPKQVGQSYRLIFWKSVVNGQVTQALKVKACVDAALGRSGMYEAPANVPPDLFIAVNYGMDTTTRIDPAARDSFLQLAARANRQHTVAAAQEGEELWDVRVSITGLATRLEAAMPMLSAVASNYIGIDTHVETIVEIPENSPEVAAVRESAIKTLSAAATTQAATAAAPAAAK